MSHPQQLYFINQLKNVFPNHFRNKKILEVGSLNINGTVRTFFENCDYIGLDVASGKDVDIVCQGQDYDAEDNTFDVVISCECFEHNPEWIATFQNMYRMCKPGGLIIMTCATTGRKEHGTTRSDIGSSPLTVAIGWEYYKNLEAKDFFENFNIEKMFNQFQFLVESSNFDLYFYGTKNS